jgi:hypothetical protein
VTHHRCCCNTLYVRRPSQAIIRFIIKAWHRQSGRQTDRPTNQKENHKKKSAKSRKKPPQNDSSTFLTKNMKPSISTQPSLMVSKVPQQQQQQ